MGKVAVLNGEIDRPLPILGVQEQLQIAMTANPFQHLLVVALSCFVRQLDADAVVPARSLATLHGKRFA